jgi:P-type Ca2+ transporter type 2C
MVYAGTAVTYGRGRALIVATGMQSELGKITGLLKGLKAST